jgi:hypothetical protein
MRERIKQLLKPGIHLQITVSLAGLLILMLSVAWYARQQTMPAGLSIGDWDVSGLSYREFYDALQSGLKRLESQRVVIYSDIPAGAGGGTGQAGLAAQVGQARQAERTAPTGRVAQAGQTAPIAPTAPAKAPSPPSASSPPLATTLGDIGIHANVDAIIAKTSALHEGPLLTRAVNRWLMRGRRIELELMTDHERLMRMVENRWREMLQREPVNAVRTIGPRDEVILTPDRPAFRIDAARLQSEVDRHVLSIFYAAVDSASESAAPGLPGPSKMPAEVRIELPLRLLPADVTVEQLEEQGIRGKIMEFSTPILPGSAGRLHNIRATAAVVHDMLLAPGEVFDFAEVVNKTARIHGFREAPVILNGRLVPGIGGGICQVSTTLYNAAIRIGLEIVERRNHSLPISYAPLGQDATFSSGSINFRFRNSLSSHLLIRTETTGSRMTVKLFGTAEPGVSYRIQSTVKETVNPPVKYVHNPKLKPGEQVTVVKGRAGYVVETVRIRYENGKPVRTERLSLDRYQPQPHVVAVNRPGAGAEQERPAPHAPKKPLIEDGVFAPLF